MTAAVRSKPSARALVDRNRRSRNSVFRHTLMYSVSSGPWGQRAMNAERINRRLAAILAADVAGYSRLMGADEEGTLMRLKALRRELIDPGIAEHKGRIV